MYLKGHDEENPHSIEASEYLPKRADLNEICFSQPFFFSYVLFAFLFVTSFFWTL